MTDTLDRDLAAANPVTDDHVRRLTGPHAREDLLADILAGPRAARPVAGAVAGPVVVASPLRRLRALPARGLLPVLVAAAVAAVVVLTGVTLRSTGPAGPGPYVGVARPGPAAAPCPGVTVPGSPQVVLRDADAVFCVHVPSPPEMSATGPSDAPAGGTAPTAWAALSVGGGPADLLLFVAVSPVRAPAADEVVLLTGTSDAFPDDAVDGDGVALPTHRLLGTAGAGVEGVEVVLPDGTTVPAALADGVWGAWWPADRGGPDDSDVRVRTATGTTTTALDDVRLPEASRLPDAPAPFLPGG